MLLLCHQYSAYALHLSFGNQHADQGQREAVDIVVGYNYDVFSGIAFLHNLKNKKNPQRTVNCICRVTFLRCGKEIFERLLCTMYKLKEG